MQCKMMMKKIVCVLPCFLILCICTSNAQQNSYFNGLSAYTGNLAPDGPDCGLSLQSELIHLRELDSTVLYDILYEFKNTTSSYCDANVMMPLNLYFNEFAPGKRSPLLDKLAIMPAFSDIFKLQDPTLDAREQIRQNFAQRLFIRRYINADNLKQLGIYVSLFRNGKPINIKKILVEIKFMDEDHLNQAKNTEVLAFEIKFMTDFTFNPGEQTHVLAYLKLPSLICGIDEKQTYTAYQIGYAKNWEGPIGKLYLEHNIFRATPVLPTGTQYTTQFAGSDNQVLVAENIMPHDTMKIGFFHISRKPVCGNVPSVEEMLIVPAAVTNISASSWVKSKSDLPNRTYVQTNSVAFSDSIHGYQTGNPTNLDLFAKHFHAVEYASPLASLVSNSCKGGKSSINMLESGSPVYAFDVCDYNDEDSAYAGLPELQKQTSWCEDVPGKGTGEYLEFELTEPASGMRIFNGNLVDRSTFDASSKTDIIKITGLDGQQLDPVSKDSVLTFSVIDIPIENWYNYRFPKGRYRIALNSVENGQTPVTCICSINFDFVPDDPWLQQAITELNSTFKKPQPKNF